MGKGRGVLDLKKEKKRGSSSRKGEGKFFTSSGGTRKGK